MKSSDTALYTCTASSESGETSWSASLSVEDPKNPNIIFHKTPDPSTFPSAPTRPRIVDRRATSVTIWRSGGSAAAGGGGAAMSSSPLIGYTVEYFSSDLETGWVVAAHRVTSETYTVGNLKPDTSYVFLVRAENSRGMSPPSQMSERVRTLRALKGGGGSSALDDGMADLSEVQEDLLNKVVELSSIEAVSSTAIRVSWSVPESVDARALAHVEGFFVRFRDMSGGSQKFNMKTVMREDPGRRDGGCTISNLRKFTEYEVFLAPFFRRLEGQVRS